MGHAAERPIVRHRGVRPPHPRPGLAVLLVALCAAPLAGQDTLQAGPPAAPPRADSLFRQHARAALAEHGLPAAGVAVAGSGGQRWSMTISGGNAEAPPLSAPFRAGPLTELVTAAAVHYLDATGRLSLDGPVTELLPDLRLLPPDELTEVSGATGRAFVGYLPEVTPRMLLEHRAGLPVDAPVGTRPGAPPAASAAAVVASLRGRRLVRAPGETGGVSRAGLAALAAAVEAATGAAFAPFVRERILAPVGIAGGAVLPEAPRATLVPAWRRRASGRLEPARSVPRGAAAAEGLALPVEDGGRLVAALLGAGEGEGSPPAAAFAAVGATLAAGEVDGLPARLHVGSGGGASTALILLPERGLGVVVLLPVEGTAELARRLAHAALMLTLAEAPRMTADPPVAAPAPPSAADLALTDTIPLADALAFVGSYRGAEFALEMAPGNGGLVAEFPARAVVRQRGDTLWITDPALPLEPLVPLPGGHLLLRADTLLRTVAAPPRPAPPGWRGLVGEYGSDADPLGVHEAVSGLRLRLDARTEHTLEPAGRDVFVLTGPGRYAGETVRFERSPEGTATALHLGAVRFPRRIPAGGDDFRIRPRRPISVLRRDALAATPPVESGTFLPTDLVELRDAVPGVRYDIRYATVANFMGAVFYTDAVAYLQRPAAEALARVSERLAPLGFGLLIHDAYRPWHVTKMFWDATPDELKDFVADPALGSRHNRGAAVDLSLYDLSTGEPVAMPSGYDEFTERAHADYPGGTARQRWHRTLLRAAMAAEGFAVYDMEWWHFDYTDWRRWRIGNATFTELMGAGR